MSVAIAGNQEGEAARFNANFSLPGDAEQYASLDVGSVHFGPGTPYLGVYGLMTIETGKLTLKNQGLSASGSDTELDSLERTK